MGRWDTYTGNQGEVRLLERGRVWDPPATKETKPYRVCRKERSQNGAGCVEEPLVRLASLGTYPQSGKITGGPVCRPYEI